MLPKLKRTLMQIKTSKLVYFRMLCRNGPLNQTAFTFFFLNMLLKKEILWTISTYNKTITILDENITNATIAFEKSFQVFLPHSIRKASNIDPCPYHAAIRKSNNSLVTYHKSVSILQRYFLDSTISPEEPLNVTFPCLVT